MTFGRLAATDGAATIRAMAVQRPNRMCMATHRYLRLFLPAAPERGDVVLVPLVPRGLEFLDLRRLFAREGVLLADVGREVVEPGDERALGIVRIGIVLHQLPVPLPHGHLRAEAPVQRIMWLAAATFATQERTEVDPVQLPFRLDLDPGGGQCRCGDVERNDRTVVGLAGRQPALPRDEKGDANAPLERGPLRPPKGGGDRPVDRATVPA